jgi:rhodanese-related sulfurtransferase
MPVPLSVYKVKELIGRDAIILDTRPASAFNLKFIPGSVFFGLEERSTEWIGDLLNNESSILLVTEKGQEDESISLLHRLGIGNIAGYLEDGIDSWLKAGEPSDMIIEIEPDELLMDMPHDTNLLVIDVRRQTEYEAGHLADAINIPLDEMGDLAVFAGL